MCGNVSSKQRRRTSKRTGETANSSSRLTILLIATFSTVAVVVALVASTVGAKTYEPILPQTSSTQYPSASWETATPQEVGMDPLLFAAAMDKMPSPSLVIRNGKIIGQKGD